MSSASGDVLIQVDDIKNYEDLIKAAPAFRQAEVFVVFDVIYLDEDVAAGRTHAAETTH
jgi:hypothetical protein